MATATVTKDDVAALVKGQAELKQVVDELIEKSKQSGSRASGKPEDMLRDSMKDGVAFFDGRGRPINLKSYRGSRTKSLSEIERADGKRGTLGELIVNLRDFGHHSIDPERRAKAAEVCKAYRVEQYNKHLNNYGPDEYIAKSSLIESDAVRGGYAVLPTEYSNQLYEIAIEDNIVEKRAYKHPLTTRQATIPALDQVNETFTAVAGQSNLLAGMNLTWVAEAATRKESEPLFRNIVGTAWEGSFYALVSNNLLADNAVGLQTYLTELFGRVVGWGKDYAYFQGNGVGQPLGMLNCKAAIQVTRSGGAGTSTLSYADICTMEGKLYTLTRKTGNIFWAAHPTMKPKILQLNDNSGTTSGTGRLVFQPINEGAQAAVEAPEGAQSYGTILGYPVFITEKVPAIGGTGDLGLYDASCYAAFQRMDIEIAISTQVNFLQNATAYRIVTRGDGQPMLGNFITYADAGASSTASPFILLH